MTGAPLRYLGDKKTLNGAKLPVKVGHREASPPCLALAALAFGPLAS